MTLEKLYISLESKTFHGPLGYHFGLAPFPLIVENEGFVRDPLCKFQVMTITPKGYSPWYHCFELTTRVTPPTPKSN